MRFKNILFFIALTSASLYAENFYKDHRQGWFFYQNPVYDEDNISEEILKSMDAKTLEAKILQLKDIAVSDPTKINVANYILAQNVAVKRSSQFAKIWKEVTLENSELDIAAPLAKSGFENGVKSANQRMSSSDFWRENINKIGFVAFFDPSDKIENKAMERVYYLLATELKHKTGQEPVIRFVDLTQQPQFKDELGIVTTPDNFIIYEDELGQAIYKRIKAGLATKGELFRNVDFVIEKALD